MNQIFNNLIEKFIEIAKNDRKIVAPRETKLPAKLVDQPLIEMIQTIRPLTWLFLIR